MICILDENNKIINIVNAEYPVENNERLFYPWNRLWEQYTDVEPFDYAKNRYINAAGAEFANRRDEVRWIEIAGVTYGFDCAPEDITNFMAAYTPLMVKQDGETGYKVWLDKDKKGLVMLNYASMKKAYDTVRNSQLAAYVWYEDIKAKLIAVTEAEGKEKLEEVFPIGG
ncbi:hypothetical protein NE479_03775 [Phascolarctobacterium faecium]|uniref:DUF4376 domain-containing protein n=1 Tax=Phascolarctobacterium faecium TaxID=33025 RepID=UPI00210910E9|nr:hypothetical protein [Phascolarctobacterium faecium]MCQ4906681.1 hypothetical protein [Phascolarctobacterium faecium]